MSLGRQKSRSNLPEAAPARRPAERILVLVLHLPEAQSGAESLAAIWRPSVPAAEISLICAPMNGAGAARHETIARQVEAQMPPRHTILVGIQGSEALALDLAFSSPVPLCGGLLICGGTVPDPEPISRPGSTLRPSCRLVFGEDDETAQLDPLRGLLRQLRLAGVNVRAALFNTNLDLSSAAPGGRPEIAGYMPSVVRMGGTYLAELVATALASESSAPVTHTRH